MSQFGQIPDPYPSPFRLRGYSLVDETGTVPAVATWALCSDPIILWTHSLDRKLCRGCYNFVLVSHPPTVQPACCLPAILVLRLVLIRIRIVTHPDQICFLSTRSLCVTWRTRPVRRLKILWIVRTFADSIVFWLILMIDDLLHD